MGSERRLPRLHVPAGLAAGATVDLMPEQAHHLRLSLIHI